MSLQTIDKVHIYPIEIPLSHNFATSKAVQPKGQFIIVEVISGELSGFGEADPRPHVTGETFKSTVSVLKEYLIPAVLGKSIFDLEGIHRAMDVLVMNPTAKCALDIAVFDLIGKALGLPVYTLLGGLNCEKISLNAWCGIEDYPDSVMEMIQDKIKEGFVHACKIKVGRNHNQDYETIQCLADIMPQGMDLIIDANQAWNYTSARKFLDQLIGSRVTVVEQPVHSEALDIMKSLTCSLPFNIMADESLWSLANAFHLAKMDVVNMFNIKPMKCGGLYPAKKIASVAESAGIRCMIGSTLQTSISAVSQLHLAVACQVFDYADISIPSDFLTFDIAEGFDTEHGVATPSSKPGLGITINRELLLSHTVEEIT